MKSPGFIREMLSKAKDAGDRVTYEFNQLTFEQLNWKPSPAY